MTKRRAIAIVVAGIILTLPGQFAISMAGLTEAFADADARYVMGTAEWLVYTLVTVGVGLSLAFVICILFSRRLDRTIRSSVRFRFGVALVAIVLLAALSDLGNAEYDESGQLAKTGLTPFMLLVWIAGSALAVWLMSNVKPPETVAGE